MFLTLQYQEIVSTKMKSKHWVSALSGLSIALLTLSVVKAADGTPPIIPGLTRTADGDYAGQPEETPF